MTRGIKILLGIVGTFVVLAGGIAVLINANLKPDVLKKRIETAVVQATCRELRMEGQLSLTLFPWVGVAFGPVSIANPPTAATANGQSADFLSIKGGAVRVAVMPLLSGQVVVDEIRLDDLHLELARAADGTTNWDFACPGQPAAASQPQAAATPPPAAQQPATPSPPAQTANRNTTLGLPAGLEVGRLSIARATLAYRDGITGQDIRARELNILLEDLRPGSPATLSLDTLLALRNPEMEAALSFKGRLQADGGALVRAQGLQIIFTPRTGLIPAAAGPIRLNGDVAYDLNASRANLSNLQLTTPHSSLAANITANLGAAMPGAVPGTDIQFKITGSPRKTLASLGVVLNTADATALDATDLTGTVSLQGTTVNIASLKGNVDSTAITAALRIATGETPPAQPAQQKGAAAPTAARKTAALAPPAPTTTPAATNTAGGATPVSIRGDIAMTAVDVDRYLPPKSGTTPAKENTGKETTPAKGPEQAPQQDDRAALRALTMDVGIKLGSLKVSRVELHEITLRIRAAKGVITIDPLGLALYGGRIDGNLLADLSGKEARTRTRLDVRNVDVGPLQDALVGKRHVLARVSTKADLTTAGETEAAIKRSLTGTATVDARDITVLGFQVIPEGAGDAAKGGKGQKFDSLTSSFKADSGVVRNNDLLLRSPNINGKGAGTIDLPRNTIDYAATLSLPALPDIPIKVSGALDAPSYGVDGTKMLQNTLKGAGNVIQKPVDGIKSILPGTK